MSEHCRCCLLKRGDCQRCLRRLFGRAEVPTIAIEMAKLHTAALGIVGRTSLSGVQRKISLSLKGERATLQADVEGVRFILKPQTETFPQLPENEHLTMQLAQLFGLDIPPCGLFPLMDGSPAYIVRRFDRIGGGRKLCAEDFCQLAQQPPKDKYKGSAELCARLVRHFCDEPGVESLKLYRLFLFSWWVGNGDLHLKNLALVTEPNGLTHLSPCFDLLSTRLVIPDDSLALTVAGKRDRLKPRDWLAWAQKIKLPVRAAKRILQQPRACLQAAVELIEASTLEDHMKSAYTAILTQRAT